MANAATDAAGGSTTMAATNAPAESAAVAATDAEVDDDEGG